MKLSEIYGPISRKVKGLGAPQDAIDKLVPVEYDVITEYFTPKELKGLLEEGLPGEEIITKNIRHCIASKGKVGRGMSKSGRMFPIVCDYTEVPFELIDFDDVEIDFENPEKRPPFLPYLSRVLMFRTRFMPEVIRVGNDKYLFCETYDFRSAKPINLNLLTLDQVVIAVEYYIAMQKEIYRKDALAAMQRQIDNYLTYDVAVRENFYNSRFRWEDLKAAQRLKISKEEFNALPVDKKEKYALPFKPKIKKVKTNFGQKSMTINFHQMYEDFIDPTAKLNGRYGHPSVFKYFYAYQEFLKWKIADFRHLRSENRNNSDKGFITSFRHEGTTNQLLEKYGIAIKRQNGDAIRKVEIEDIDRVLGMDLELLGDFSHLLKAVNLVVSHADKTRIYRRQFIGIFIPSIPTIGISRIGGANQFASTAAHELAHFLDFFGSSGSHWYESMNYESTAGKIAAEFRANMNRWKPSEYFSSSVECFARAMEQYFVMHYFENGEFGYFSNLKIDSPSIITQVPYYCSKEKFETYVQPLIEQWIREKDYGPYKAEKSGGRNLLNFEAQAQAQRLRLLKLKSRKA